MVIDQQCVDGEMWRSVGMEWRRGRCETDSQTSILNCFHGVVIVYYYSNGIKSTVSRMHTHIATQN